MRELSNNKVIAIINKLVDAVILSLLWVLCSLPLITIGASSAALYQAVTESVIEDKGYAYKLFFKSFKLSFRQSIFFTVVFLLFTVTFLFIIYFFYHNPMGFFSQVYSVFSLFCLALTALAGTYAFALIGSFELTSRQILSLLVRLIFRNLPRSLLILIAFALIVNFTISYPFLLFAAPSGYALIVSLLMKRPVKKYIHIQ